MYSLRELQVLDLVYIIPYHNQTTGKIKIATKRKELNKYIYSFEKEGSSG